MLINNTLFLSKKTRYSLAFSPLPPGRSRLMRA